MQPLRDDALRRALAEALLAEDAEHAFVLLDLQGVIVGWMGAAPRLFGHAAADVLGRHLDELFVPDDRARRQPQEEIVAAQRVGRAEDDRWHLRRDGAAVWVSGSLTALHAPDGTPIGYAKVMRDRTDLRTQVETLEARVESLNQRLEAARLMLRTVGHELRNPLAPMLNVAGLLEHGGSAVDPALPARILRRQVALMQRLVDDLMDFARGDSGQLALRLADFALQELLVDVVGAYRAAAAAQGLQLELLLPQAPITLCADRERLQQVLGNLLDNALRHNGPGHRVVVRASAEPPDAVVRVEDDGAGIAPSLLPHVFELFTRGATTPEGRHGLGIGLAMAKAIVERHGGSIEARSAGVGRGAAFTVRLPARPHPA